MSVKIVKPGEPSVSSPVQLVVLPKEEARRMRQLARDSADALMPAVMAVYAKMIESEDLEMACKGADRIREIAMSKLKSNEDIDPHEAVHGTLQRVDDPVAELEKETENGDGSGT